MAQIDPALSTGIKELDFLFKGLIPGDSMVWQVESVEDYSQFVQPFYQWAIKSGRRVIYFRFADHPPLIDKEAGVEIHSVDPQVGFEAFLRKIRTTIERAGKGSFFIFDCVSDLTRYLYSDQMIGNFFMLTSPLLNDMEGLAYFALIRNYHSFHATTAINEVVPLILDVYNLKDKCYLQPKKVLRRHSPTMSMMHVWENDTFRPVGDSCTIAELMTSGPTSALESATYRLGTWTQTFKHAQEIHDRIEAGTSDPEEGREIFRRLLLMIVSREGRVLELAFKYFTLDDLLTIWKRMVGTGLIGGKAVGMLLARAILRANGKEWEERLEAHDSFFIASDVFYTFLVRNGCWWVPETDNEEPTNFLNQGRNSVLSILRQRIMMGTFPKRIEFQFANVLDYFGQSPIVVRSSSLLEDNFGNSFAGMYESVFCVNQGPPEQRLEDFIAAVKTIYASVLSERALAYRARRKMLDRDEHMGVLVQRVSGSKCGDTYYPLVAGVGLSYNPYVWSEQIDPKAGLMRLVFGLGTRAVDRFEDDYTRVVSLSAPERRPDAGGGEKPGAQRKVDVLDLEGNQLVTVDFQDLVKKSPDLPLSLVASRDYEYEKLARQRGMKNVFSWSLTFDELLKRSDFVPHFREMLRLLEEAYSYPVDIEFTANFNADGGYKINLVQCRPLQVKGVDMVINLPTEVDPDKLFFQSMGPVIGLSRKCQVERIIYVDPAIYGQLPIDERYAIARLIGRITHLKEETTPENIMLLGPGRWGTTTPSLGVPVNFTEIEPVSILCEVVAMSENIIPDVSLGTHFFSELVETNMLYLALFPNRESTIINEAKLKELPNRLADLLPDDEKYSAVVKIYEQADWLNHHVMNLYADCLKQRMICCLD